MADALVIASVAGGVLFEKAQKEYMRRAPRPYMKIINAIMSHDLTGKPHPFRGSCLPCHTCELLMIASFLGHQEIEDKGCHATSRLLASLELMKASPRSTRQVLLFGCINADAGQKSPALLCGDCKGKQP